MSTTVKEVHVFTNSEDLADVFSSLFKLVSEEDDDTETADPNCLLAGKKDDDPEEEHDTPKSAPRHGIHVRAGLCEIAGLVRRARSEVVDGETAHALRTLGRVQDALERELAR